METSILTSKGQLLIPKRLRTKYGIKSGIKVIFEETDKGVLIKPMNEQYFKSFAGILKAGNLAEDIKKMKEEEKTLEEKRLHTKPVKK
jgi:AbrB family looped-hinge helix DNA binding protein